MSPSAIRRRYSRSSSTDRGFGNEPPPLRRKEKSNVFANSSRAAVSIRPSLSAARSGTRSNCRFHGERPADSKGAQPRVLPAILCAGDRLL